MHSQAVVGSWRRIGRMRSQMLIPEVDAALFEHSMDDYFQLLEVTNLVYSLRSVVSVKKLLKRDEAFEAKHGSGIWIVFAGGLIAL